MLVVLNLRFVSLHHVHCYIAPDIVARAQVPNSLFSEGVNSSIANTVRQWAQNNLFCIRVRL